MKSTAMYFHVTRGIVLRLLNWSRTAHLQGENKQSQHFVRYADQLVDAILSLHDKCFLLAIFGREARNQIMD